jgi:hypothetical protein
MLASASVSTAKRIRIVVLTISSSVYVGPTRTGTHCSNARVPTLRLERRAVILGGVNSRPMS